MMMLPMEDLQPPSVGVLLKNRRNEMGLSLTEIAARTNIRRSYLEALEADRYEVLPGAIYQSGFLRNYAETLGLESASVLQQWRSETAKPAEGKRGKIPATQTSLSVAGPSRRWSRRGVFILALLLAAAVGLYISVRSWQGGEVLVSAPSSPANERHVQRADAPTLGDGSLPPSTRQTENDGGSENRALEAVAAVAPFPPVPTAGGALRLEALGPLTVEVAVDGRPPLRYDLNAASSLQWNVGSSARLSLDDPAAVKIWLGGELLELAGRSEIVLEAATPE